MGSPVMNGPTATLIRLVLGALGRVLCRDESMDYCEVDFRDLPTFIKSEYRCDEFPINKFPSKPAFDKYSKVINEFTKILKIETTSKRPAAEDGGKRQRYYFVRVRLQPAITREYAMSIIGRVVQDAWWRLVACESIKFIMKESKNNLLADATRDELALTFSGPRCLTSNGIRYGMSKLICPKWFKSEPSNNVMVVDPDWYQTLPTRFKEVLRNVWKPGEDTHSNKAILIPVSIDNQHWVIARVERVRLHNFRVHVIDSLMNHQLPDTANIVMERTKALLKLLVNDEVNVSLGTVSTGAAQQQLDDYNCGMHVVTNLVTSCCPQCLKGLCDLHMSWNLDDVREMLNKQLLVTSSLSDCPRSENADSAEMIEIKTMSPRTADGKCGAVESVPNISSETTSKHSGIDKLSCTNSFMDNASIAKSNKNSSNDTGFVSHESHESDNEECIEHTQNRHAKIIFQRHTKASPSFEYHFVDTGNLKALFTSYVHLVLMNSNCLCANCGDQLRSVDCNWSVEVVENGISDTYHVQCNTCGQRVRSLPSFCTSANSTYDAREAVDDLMEQHQTIAFQTASRFRRKQGYKPRTGKQVSAPKKHVNYALLAGTFNSGTGIERARNLLNEMGVRTPSESFLREAQKSLHYEVIDLSVDLLAMNRCNYVAELDRRGLLRALTLRLSKSGLRVLGLRPNVVRYVTAYFAFGSTNGTKDSNLILTVPGTDQSFVGALSLDPTSCNKCTRSLQEYGTTEHEGCCCVNNAGSVEAEAATAAHFRMASHCCHPNRYNGDDRLLVFHFFSTDQDTSSYEDFVEGQFVTLQTYYDLTEEQKELFAPWSKEHSRVIQAPDLNQQIKVFKKCMREHLCKPDTDYENDNYFTLGMIDKLTCLITQNLRKLATKYVYPAIKRYKGDMLKVFQDAKVVEASKQCEVNNFVCFEHICNTHIQCATDECAVKFTMVTLDKFNANEQTYVNIPAEHEGVFRFIHDKMVPEVKNRGPLSRAEMKALCSEIVVEAENNGLLNGLKLLEKDNEELKCTAEKKLRFDWAQLDFDTKRVIRRKIARHFSRMKCLRMSVMGTSHSKMLRNFTESNLLSCNDATGMLAIKYSVASEATHGSEKFRMLLDNRLGIERANTDGITVTHRRELDKQRVAEQSSAMTSVTNGGIRRQHKYEPMPIPCTALKYTGNKRNVGALPTTDIVTERHVLQEVEKPPLKRARVCTYCSLTHPPGSRYCFKKSTTEDGKLADITIEK